MFFQVVAVVSVVDMVLMKMVVFVEASLLRGAWILSGHLILGSSLIMDKHLLHGCIKMSVVLKPTLREVDRGPSPAVDIAFSPPVAFVLQ